jgi:hypothetical protein
MGSPTDNTVNRIPGLVMQPGAETPFVNYLFVSPGYFASPGAPLQRWRDIADSDILTAFPVTIINDAMARKFWPGENPIGKQLSGQTMNLRKPR